MIENIFAIAASFYGHRFTSQYPTATALEAAKSTWSMGLKSLNSEQLKNGLNFLMNETQNPFPPTLPEFRGWCLKDISVPAEDEAFQKCIRREFSHPMLENIFKKITTWDWTHDSEQVLRKKFRAVYKAVSNNNLCLN